MPQAVNKVMWEGEVQKTGENAALGIVLNSSFVVK